MKQFMMVMFVCLFSQTAWAGWVVTNRNVDTGAKNQEFFEGRNMSAEGMIYKDGYLIVVDRGSRAYWKGTPQQYCEVMNAINKKLKAQMDLLPAQFQPKPISQSKVTRKNLGKKAIAGFSATGYTFFVDGHSSKQIWVSSDSGLSRVIDFGHSMEKKMKCFTEMGDLGLESTAIYKRTVEDAFILKDSNQQVVSVEKKSISSDRFNAPRGYKSFSDFNSFTKHISNHSSSSSRSPSRPSMPSFDMPSRRRASSARSESRASSHDDTDQSGQPSDGDQIPNMDDIKKGAGEMLKSLGGLFGN